MPRVVFTLALAITSLGCAASTAQPGARESGGPAWPSSDAPEASGASCPEPPKGAPASEVAKRADDVIVRLDRASSRVSVLLREARSSRDTARSSCRDERLSQLNATARDARAQKTALAGYPADETSPRVDTTARILVMHCGRIDRLVREAEACGAARVDK